MRILQVAFLLLFITINSFVRLQNVLQGSHKWYSAQAEGRVHIDTINSHLTVTFAHDLLHTRREKRSFDFLLYVKFRIHHWQRLRLLGTKLTHQTY